MAAIRLPLPNTCSRVHGYAADPTTSEGKDDVILGVTPRRSVRYIISAERVSQKARQLNLTQDQKSQLRERTNTDASAAEAAILKLYAEVWLPKADQGGLTIDRIAAGGRPLQATLNQKKQAAIHERVEELITSVQPRVFATLHPNKIVELFALGTASDQTPGRSVPEIVEGFFSFPRVQALVEE